MRGPAAATTSVGEPDALLSVEGLRASYGRAVTALRGVSLQVPEGSVVAVLGSNGAGKSTLLRAISGTLGIEGGAVDAGSIVFDGRRLEGRDPAEIVRAGIVQVPEGRRVFADLSVEENLRAGALAAPDRSTREQARQRVFELFPVLAQRRRQRAGLMSGGEQQMLAIGRALMAAPRLLLLDEPSLGLAPMIVDQIGEVIAQINRQGTAVVLVEQNAAMALRISERAFVLEVGEITLSGASAELAGLDTVRERYLGAAAEGDGGRNGTEDVGTGPGPATSAPQAQSPAQELIVEDLGVRFSGISALEGVSFRVQPGSVHALIGPNGAGKSTCINVLSGVYQATQGSVRYGGQELTGRSPHRIAALGICRTFQNISLSPQATVLDNLLVARHRLTRAGIVSAGLRLPAARREQRAQERAVGEIAELLSLNAQLDRPVASLAYGERKRVELARALCSRPSLLLLDEPVAGMNRGESDQMGRAIAAVRRELGVSILLVEHDMPFVMGMAQRITVLDFGRLIADGSPDEVRNDPAVLRAYLGAQAEAEGGPS